MRSPLLIAAALGATAFLLAARDPARGATTCTPASSSAPGSSAPAQCAKAAKPPKAKALPTVAVSAAPLAAPVSDSAPSSWKHSLDPLSAGGWVLISDGPIDNPSVVYASSHNVVHNGNVVIAWIRWEYSRQQADIYPLRYQSAVTHEELDCDQREYRRAAVFYYRRNNLQDKALQFTALNDDTTWKLAIPGTEGDAMLNWACTQPATAHHSAAHAKGKGADKSDDGDDDKAADAKPTVTSTDRASDKPAKPGSGKSGGTAAAGSSAPSSAPAPAGGGIDLHTNR